MFRLCPSIRMEYHSCELTTAQQKSFRCKITHIKKAQCSDYLHELLIRKGDF